MSEKRMTENSEEYEEILEPFRKEYVLCNKLFRDGVTVFTSQEALSTYQRTKRVKHNDTRYNEILKFQREGMGIPLLLCDFPKISTKHAIIYAYEAPHEEAFDIKKDRREICTVKKRLAVSYYKYQFDFNFGDADKFTINFYLHYRLPIGDTTPFNNHNSYRWIHNEYHMSRSWYVYMLFLLGKEDDKLTDNMNTSSGDLDPKNKLVDGRKVNLFKLSKRNVQDVHVPNVNLGKLESTRTKYFGSYQMKAKFILRSVAEDSSHSIYAVDRDDLIFLSIASVLKGREDERKEKRRAAASAS